MAFLDYKFVILESEIEKPKSITNFEDSINLDYVNYKEPGTIINSRIHFSTIM